MKASISGGVKTVLVRKLSNVLQQSITLMEFNELFVHLDRLNSYNRIIPYGVFENEDNFVVLDKTESGRIFKAWLLYTTKNIPKDFNKGRKLVRQFKDYLELYQDVLAFNLSVPHLFMTSLAAFFYVPEPADFLAPVENEERFYVVLEEFRGYLASIFVLDLVSEMGAFESLLDIFINSDDQKLIKSVVLLGQDLIKSE